MLVSFLDLLRFASRAFGDFGPGYSPSLSKQKDALLVLNMMLDAWAIDQLRTPATLISVFDLVPNQQEYTWGPGQTDFPGPRPNRIVDCNLIILSNPEQPLRQRIAELDDDGWSRINLLGVASTIPLYYYLSKTYPTAILKLWPYPTFAYQIEFFTTGTLDFIPNINSSVDFPPGYAEAIAYNWAVRLAPQWGHPVTPEMQNAASMSLMQIQNINAPSPRAVIDAAAFSPSQGRIGTYFNWYTGDVD